MVEISPADHGSSPTYCREIQSNIGIAGCAAPSHLV